mmetsp:Transcript_17389/g.31382  ORF Transcript_17389/g.31382 Transcript_17389/m.31382 type:complete len:187 (+) Transcript_17389:746-1306(+)
MQDLCRICYNSAAEPLISPCNCKGSVAYVHKLCLINWLKIRFPARVKMLLMHRRTKLRGLKCELCKVEYAGQVRLMCAKECVRKVLHSNNALYFLLNLPMLIFVLYKLKWFSLHLFRTTTKSYLRALYSHDYKLLKFFLAHLKVTASFIRLCVFSCALPVLFKSCFSLMSVLYNECLDIDIISRTD